MLSSSFDLSFRFLIQPPLISLHPETTKCDRFVRHQLVAFSIIGTIYWLQPLQTSYGLPYRVLDWCLFVVGHFWRLLLGWNRDGRDIGWAEMVAIELGLLFYIHQGHSDIHFIIKSDNQDVIYTIEGGKSWNAEQNSVLQWITALLAHNKIWISSSYVPSSDNLADLPSCGLPVPNYPCTISSIPPRLQPFIFRPVI